MWHPTQSDLFNAETWQDNSGPSHRGRANRSILTEKGDTKVCHDSDDIVDGKLPLLEPISLEFEIHE